MHLGENCSCLPTNLNLTSWKMWCENLENVTVVALLEEPKKASLLSTLQQSLEMKQHHFSNGGPINQMEDRCSNVSKSIPFKVSQYFSIFHIVSNDYILSKKSSWWKHFENSQFGFFYIKIDYWQRQKVRNIWSFTLKLFKNRHLSKYVHAISDHNFDFEQSKNIENWN